MITLTAVMLVAAATAAGGEPWFADVTRESGIRHEHENRSFENPYAHIMEGYTALGAAAAAGDFDGDGLVDLFLTTSSATGTNRLYRNLGGMRFEDVSEKAGLGTGNDARNASTDALWLDYDGDGDLDLFLAQVGQSLLFENLGAGRFRDVTARAGLADRRFNAIAAVAFDHDGDGDQDLFVANYFSPVDLFDPETPRFFPESFETAANGGGLTLWRNQGDGTFVDRTEAAGLAGHTGWSLDLGHADADLDGDQDLYVAADFGTDRYFENRGDGTFADRTETAIGIDTKKGMNADWGDFDNDGLFDVYVTNITDEYMREGNFLWKGLGDGTFTDVARETGTWDTGWGWAGKFFDYDNDGWLDLYVVNGWVSAGSGNYVLDIFELIVTPDVDLADARNWPPMGDKTLSGYQHNRLFHNEGGLFREVGKRHGVDLLADGRGVAVADFDGDGRLDLYVANANGPGNLFANRAPTTGGWLGLTLESADGTTAIGARAELVAEGHRWHRFVDGGNGFASQSTTHLHFGLADSIPRELVVHWPSGRRQALPAPAPNRHYELREGGKPVALGSPTTPPKPEE